MKREFYYYFIICIGILSCSISNKFTPPKDLTYKKEVKTLTIYVGNEIMRRNSGIVSGAGNTLLASLSNSDRKINLTQPRRSFAAYIFELDKYDTGSIHFLMGLEQPLGKKNFFAENSLQIKDLNTGHNFLHLNAYLKQTDLLNWAPLLELRAIDVEQDVFMANRPMKFKHVLTYNLSTDSVIFERKKAIASKQERNNQIYQRIKTRNSPIDSSLLRKLED